MFNSAIVTLGNTPLVSLSRFAPKIKLAAKLENRNPLFSVKCRTAWGMIREAECRGDLSSSGHLVEPTSGNTGIGLAWISRIRGYSLTLTMPETMSVERRALCRFFGAEIILTPGTLGMPGAIAKAKELANEYGYLFLNQFANIGNVKIHYETTGNEIWSQTDGSVDIAVFGVGTGGTLTGAGKFLKERNPKLQIVAVEPKDSPILSGGEAGKHKIQGIGAGFIPQILDISLIDSIERVTNEEAIDTAKELALTEGICVGISSGAAACAAKKVATQNPDKVVVTVLPDTAERYLSTDLFS